MKFKKIAIIGLSIALLGSLGTFAACQVADQEQPGKEPPEYTFQDGRPDGDLAEPDAGFTIDGVLNEEEYGSIQWLEGAVLRPYATNDGQGVYYDYDLIQQKTEESAHVKMGSYYGEKGVYILYSYKEQEGKVCYVNPNRRSYRNSGVELHIGVPSSRTMTGDETISRITVNANGALTVAKTQGDIWMAPFGTEDSKNMPYVGLTGNGTRTDENADRTEFTFELFIPWGYFDEAAGEGTAQSMKDGGDLVVAPGIITANNYTGNGQTDREYYVISARLDNGEWSNAQGWYHFNEGGAVGYDITVKQAEHGSVQEWMGYGVAAKNSSLTFVTKADEGYALKEFRVNGVAVSGDQISYDMYTTLGAEAESDVQKAYVKIPQKAITGDIEVEAEFAPLAEGEQTLQATVYGISTDTPLKNAKLTFTRGDTVIEATTGEDGSVTVEGLTAGLYDVAVNDIAYKTLENWVFYSAEANTQIVFGRNAILLEGRQNVNRTYTTIYNKVTSLADGFVLSGFFGFEGASWDELLAKTFTATLNFNFADGSTYGFRFTIWNPYGPMLKCQGREWNFNDNTAAMEYAEQEGGVYFMIAGDPNGSADEGISVFIKEDADTWVQIARTGGSGDYAFPFDQNLTGISFGKQDSESTDQTAVLEGGELKLGTARVDIPVTVTVNGGEEVTGGTVSLPQDIVLGESVTVTLTPETNYNVTLKVDGAAVVCTPGENGAYTYTFTAAKQSYALEVTFAKAAGDYTLNVQIDEAVSSAADDLIITVTNGSITKTAVKGSDNVWKVVGLSYGSYTVKVMSAQGDYFVLEEDITFSEDNGSTTLTIDADNYGKNRVYALNAEGNANDDYVIAENLGAAEEGFVFQGFLGVQSGSLSTIDGPLESYAAALRFTMENGFRFRYSLYIYQSKDSIAWCVKCYDESNENGNKLELGFKENQELFAYVKQEGGVHVAIAATTDSKLTVYIKTSDTEWIKLGEGQPDFPLDEKIVKVELLRKFENSYALSFGAKVEGTLRFGTTVTDIPATVTVNSGEEVTGGEVNVTQNATLGGSVTVTVSPEANYKLSSLQVDGKAVSCEESEGTYTYTFTAEKSSHAVTVTLGKMADLALNITTSGITLDEEDSLAVTLANAAGDEIELTANGENAWKATAVPYGTYTATVTSVLGGYTVLTQEMEFGEGQESFTLTVTAKNYGAQREYALAGEVARGDDGSKILLENLGTTNSFVFTGFLGMGKAEDGTQTEIAYNLRFSSEVRLYFKTADGSEDMLTMEFITWSNGSQQIKVTYGGNVEFKVTQKCAPGVYERMCEERGVHFAIVMENDVFRVYAQAADDSWVQLHIGDGDCATAATSWDSNADFANKTIQTVKLQSSQGTLREGDAITHTLTEPAVLQNGLLRFGTTDTGIAVTVNGAGSVAGGTVEVTESVTLGGEITVTLTPAAEYAFASLSVDGTPVSCTPGENDVYTYTFTASKSSHTLAAVFEKTGGAYTVNATVAETLTGAAEDLKVVLTNDSVDNEATKSGDGNAWVTGSIPYGDYTLLITSVSGGYTVLKQEVSFTEESNSVTVTIDADNYGKNRVYALNGAHALPTEVDSESGTIVIAENLGAAEEGFVFQGFLGVQSGSLSSVTGDSYGAVLIFTTESGSRFRYCLYIWAGSTWCIKCYDENNENGNKLELGFNANATLLDYVKQEGGVHVAIAATTDSKLTVYIRVNATEWIKLGEGQPNFHLTEKIVKVELLRKFGNDLAVSFGAKVEGTLRFGTTATDIPATVTVNGGEEVTGGEVEVTQNATIGGSVTVTLMPEKGYALSSLQVDGEAVSSEESEGVYTYTFTASKSNHTLTAVFEQTGGAYTVNATIAEALTGATEDLKVVLTNGSVDNEATKSGDGNAWVTGSLPYGEYTLLITSVSGGYTVLEQEVSFTEESNSVTVTVNADNYGKNRVYALNGEDEAARDVGTVIAENLGAAEGGFVLQGFLGVKEANFVANIGNASYVTALRFTTENGYRFRLCFYIWQGKYWVVKAFEEDKETAGGTYSHEFAFTDNAAMIEYVKQQNGITVSIAAATDGTLTVYAMANDTGWVLLGEWKSPFKTGEAIEKVEVLKMHNDTQTATVDGELRFGTTDTGLPAVNVLTETIDLDEKGTKYWEHYSAGEGEGETHENKPLVTRSSAEGDDRIELSFPTGFTGDGTTRGSAIDNYETRPDKADNAQAFTSSNGLNSNGFVFRSGSKPIEATITLSKGDTAVKVYTGTWISNCQFTISLTDADGNVVDSIGFTVTNTGATYETVFSVDTSSWAEEESKTFTLTCGSNNTLKLMAIAIS